MKIKWTILLILSLFLFTNFSLAFAGSIQLSWQPNDELDLKGYNVYLGKKSRAYGLPIDVGKATDYTLDGLQDETVYYLAVTAVDNSDNESGFSAEVEFKTDDAKIPPPVDTTYPVVNISSPTSMDSFDTDQASVSLSGVASDNTGVARITWKADTGLSGPAVGSATWTVSNVALSEGRNTITIHVYDNAGNEAVDQLVVNYTPADVTPPTVAITSPGTSSDNGPIETAEATFQLSGSAIDDRKVSEVRWSTDSDGGIASGTEKWAINVVPLAKGISTITVTAQDAAGNTGQASIKVNYTPLDTTAPTVTISQPIVDGLYRTEIGKVTVAGKANDDRELARVEWSSSSGDKGVANGTLNWSIANIVLSHGANEIVIKAIDTAGNQATKTLLIDYAPNADLISAVTSSSGRAYTINRNLENGNQAYIDRSYTLKNLPQALTGSLYIMTANNDKKYTGGGFLSFEASKRVMVYVSHDDRIYPKPKWMDGFENTGLKLSTDVPMSIYARVFEAGMISLGGNGGSSASSMYTVAVSETPAISTPPLEVANLSVASGENYQIQSDLAGGMVTYIDRSYTYQNVPQLLTGKIFIMTANNDKKSNSDSHLRFDLSKRARVYIAHDDRITTKPKWLSGFENTGLKLSTDVTMSLYTRVFDAGKVTLGGNGGGSASSMYSIIVSE